MTAHDENDLWARLRSGDAHAQRVLYERHSDRLRRFFSRSFPPHEADDCVSEVFLRALEAFTRNGPAAESVDRWLWGIARHVRSAHFRAAAGGELPADEPRLDANPVTPREYDTLGQRAGVAAVAAVIDTLPSTGRELMTAYLAAGLREGQEIKGARLAATLGPAWPVDRVDREMNRSKKAIRRGVAIQAVARAARSCPQAATLVPQLATQPGDGLRLADLTTKQQAALAGHAAPGGCEKCGSVFRDAVRSANYALGPGLLILAAQENSDPDEDERRRTVIAAWAHGRPEAAGSTVATAVTPAAGMPVGVLSWHPLAALMRQAQHAYGRMVSTVHHAVAPRLATVSQLAHANPAIGRIGGVVLALVAMAMVVASQPGRPPDHDDGQRSTVVAPAPSPSPAPSSSPDTPSSPTITPGGTNTDGPPGGIGPTGGVSPAPTPTRPPCPPNGSGAITPVVARQALPAGTAPAKQSDSVARLVAMRAATQTAVTFPIRIDATRLAYRSFLIPIPGVTPKFVDAGSVQDIQLAPGIYGFQFASGYHADFTFQVTGTGTVTYDPAFADFLSGAGTPTLTLSGFEVTLDARALGGIGLILAQMPGQSPFALRTARLLPARRYQVQGAGLVSPFLFALGRDGRFSYGAELDVATAGGFLRGNGTATLEFLGHPLRVDATRLFYRRMYLPGVTGPAGVDATTTVPMVRVLPGSYSYQFASGYFADFRFTVTLAGTIDYSPDYATFLSGAGGSTLTLTGLPVTFDARRLSGSGVLFADMPVISADWIRHREIRLLPASHYRFQQGSGQVAPFTVKLGLDGRFTYAAGFGSFLRGNGTATLEFLGYPVCVDTRAAGANGVTIYPIWAMPYDTSGTQIAYLLPGARFTLVTRSGGLTRAGFSLSVDGKVGIDSSLSSYLRAERSGDLAVVTALGPLPR